MSTREIIRVQSSSIKLGVMDSQIASVRTQSEEQTAVRFMEGGHVGVASAVGHADLDALTRSAKEALIFEIPYAVEPESDRTLSVEHVGQEHDVASLLEMAEAVLAALRDEYPNYVFSHGVEANRLAWHIESEAGLDLHYRRVTTQAAFIVKEKGSGNIIDSFVGTEGLQLDVDGVLETFREHMDAYGRILEPRTGRQRVIFPGLSGMASGSLLQLFRTDLLARTYVSGASIFDGKVGDGQTYFHPDLHIFEARDPDRYRVCPFDMEGVVRTPLNLDVIQRGQLCSLAANKRDAQRFGVPPTGTAVGDAAQLPVSGFGRLAGAPTVPRLENLIGDEGALLVWFVAGGDATRTGDMALPAQVVMAVDGEGKLIGRVPGCTLKGNLFNVFGEDFVGITEQTVDPYSDESFLVTHLTI
jgi:PmbA protein